MPIPHPHVTHPNMLIPTSVGSRFADAVARVFGSMSMFYSLVVWQLGWMLLAGLGVWWFGHDGFPFPFLLFLSNLIQLWALPVLGVATNRADVKRQAKADADHEALTAIAHRIDDIAADVKALQPPQPPPGSVITARARKTRSA